MDKNVRYIYTIEYNFDDYLLPNGKRGAVLGPPKPLIKPLFLYITIFYSM